MGAKHYNRIDIDLIRDYNEALDVALEEAYLEAKRQKRDPHVTPSPKKSLAKM